MNATKILSALLGIQVLLAAVTWWPRDGAVESRDVVPFEESAITRVRIESATATNRNEDGLVLEKGDDGWVVASEFDYPVLPEKAEELLSKLKQLRVRAPIATQDVRHEQLNVSASNATRKLAVQAGADSVEFYLGVANSNRSHVRIAGEDAVYEAAGVGAWSIRDTSGSYIERKVLDEDAESVESFSLSNARGAVDLVKGPEGWTASTLEEGEVIDPAKVSTLLRSLTRLTMNAPADPARDPFTTEGAAILRFSVPGEAASEERAIAAFESDGKLIVRVEGQTRPVEIGAAATKDAFLTTDLEGLLVSEPEAPTPL